MDTLHKHIKCIKCSSEHKELMAVSGIPVNIMHQLVMENSIAQSEFPTISYSSTFTVHV